MKSNNDNCNNYTITNNVSVSGKDNSNCPKKHPKIKSKSDKSFPQPSKPVNAAN